MRTRSPMPDLNYIAGQNATVAQGTLTWASGAVTGTVVTGAITLGNDYDSTATYYMALYNTCSGSVNTVRVYNQYTMGGSQRDVIINTTAVPAASGVFVKLEGLGLAETMKITATNATALGPNLLDLHWIIKDA